MLKNNFVIWFNILIWTLGLCLFSCLGDSTGPDKDPLAPLVGTYTAFEAVTECIPESNYSELSIVPPILTSSLNIQSDKSFTWTLTIIEDEGGFVPDCLGVTSASITVVGTVSGDGALLIFDGGDHGVDHYSYTMTNDVLSIAALNGGDSFKFNKQ